MSRSNSLVSLVPASTIVGSRQLRQKSVTGKYDIHPHEALSTEDESEKRFILRVLVEQINIKQYIRDKSNEEIVNYERFVRINSKRLRCSYQIPAEEVHEFMKSLYGVLVPGIRAELLKKSQRSNDLTKLESDHLHTYYNWIKCSDLTSQVLPTTPTVLWFDLECMACKKTDVQSKQRHFKSAIIIKTVVEVVLDEISARDTVEECDTLYVTRGLTCGMHLFFPQVILKTQDDVQEVWTSVADRLLETEQRTAEVDTGCSSMPLPLARNHNGLTRVHFQRGEDGEILTKAYSIAKPTLEDLLYVTNFSHFSPNNLKTPKGTPSPTVVYSGSTSTIDRVDPEHQNTGDVLNPPVVDKPIIFEEESKEPTNSVGQNVECTIRPMDRVTVNSLLNEKVADTIVVVPFEQAEIKDLHLTEVTNEQVEILGEKEDTGVGGPSDGQINKAESILDDADGRLSNTSSTSSTTTRLRQVDIRDMCSKANKRKRKADQDEETASILSFKRRRFLTLDPSESIIIDDEDDRMSENSSSAKNMSIIESPLSKFGCSSDVNESSESFVNGGYEPSMKFVDKISKTMPSTENDRFGGMRSETVSSLSELNFQSGASSSHSLPVFPTSHDSNTPALEALRALYVSEETLPSDARLPELMFHATTHTGSTSSNRMNCVREITQAKEEFESSMKLNLDCSQNQTHKTDIQLLVSGFHAEMNFYTTTLAESTPLAAGDAFDGLRIRDGCSLHNNREECPAALFSQYIPFVLCSEDFVPETEWISVLERYFQEYLNTAPFFYLMLHVLQRDENVKKNLSEPSRRKIQQSVENCLARFKHDMMGFQKKNDSRRLVKISSVPKHPYDEKCTIVIGLMAICSLGFKIVTPIFTDLAKVCRMLSSNNQQTLESLNSSTMCTTNSNSGDSIAEDDCLFDESASILGRGDSIDDVDDQCSRGHDEIGSSQSRANKTGPASIGNNHSVIASILRWNYPALEDQTLWCLFFYYYHVHADGLARIMDEMVHGGLMVTTLLQAYFEDIANEAPIDVRMICSQVYQIHDMMLVRNEGRGEKDDDRSRMPPPSKRGTQRSKKNGRNLSSSSSEEKRQQFASRHEDSKSAQRKVQNARDGRREDVFGDDEMDAESADKPSRNYMYKTSFTEILGLIVRRYLRPVSFEESTVVYTELGYVQSQNEYSSFFASDKDWKRMAMDVFNRSVLKYSMPHGDLLMYNTDVMGTVHRRSSCTNNLVLNIFENTYGGCMSYLTRRFNNHLKLFNRFNADAYRLVVECRHAMHELVRSIELSYINLILRQPVVPPVLESDIAIRQMFMDEKEIKKGAFVCLNTMDYVRSVNMFTTHSKFSQDNCKIAESFLDRLITDRNKSYGDEDTCTRFRTMFLFYMLYIFEVLYKIRHAYNRDGSYDVSIERLSWELDVRVLLKLFFGTRQFKMPRGLSPDILKKLDLSTDLYAERAPTADGAPFLDDGLEEDMESRAATARCINTRPVVSTDPPDKMSRMVELFGRKGIDLIKSYAPLCNEKRIDTSTPHYSDGLPNPVTEEVIPVTDSSGYECSSFGKESSYSGRDESRSYEEQERTFLNMPQAKLEEALYSSSKWYDNCRIRVNAVQDENNESMKAGNSLNEIELCMDTASMDTFLRTQLRVNIDNNRLERVERSVRAGRDFSFCTKLSSRVKMIALVLASHTAKRLTADVAADFVRKEYELERTGVIRFTNQSREGDGQNFNQTLEGDNGNKLPDQVWIVIWRRLLRDRIHLLKYCRFLAKTHFPVSYFVGIEQDTLYQILHKYMLGNPKYVTLHALRDETWAKDVCAALNYLLVINAYDPELVELCLRLFLGFEWPGQWAKRIFVWKSNSNAGKSFFFEHIIGKAFDQSTCINDPKGGKDNAPEKAEYHKNFVLMTNEFTSASAAELKKLCSTSSYKFRMNFGNQMIQAFMVGKMVFNCNTLPATTDHATIQRVALVPLPFWFQKRQTVVDSMLNWTRGQYPLNEYERNFRRNISDVLTAHERKFFIENTNTKNEDDLFNRPNENSLQLLSELSNQNARASMFLVQNKTSQVYMTSAPPTETIISGIVLVTRYFCRFRFFNNIKEPVDYSALPTACNAAAQEWQRISQPYFDWKERNRVRKDPNVRTKVSNIHASLNHFAKTYSKNASFFDLKQFFECDFAEQKIPNYRVKEDEYYVVLDPLQD